MGSLPDFRVVRLAGRSIDLYMELVCQVHYVRHILLDILLKLGLTSFDRFHTRLIRQ